MTFKLKDVVMIDKLRFYLFEIGIVLAEGEAQFIIARASRELAKITKAVSLQKKNIHSYLLGLEKYSSDHQYNYIDNRNTLILKYALVLAYRSKIELNNLSSKLEENKLIYFEQLVAPRAKKINQHQFKFSFTIREFLKYSGYFQAAVKLQWYAIHISIAKVNDIKYLAKIERALPREMAIWYEYLSKNKLDLKQYLPMPIHPWQSKNIVRKYLNEISQEKLLIGPLFKQQTFPAFDHEYLLPKNPRSATVRCLLREIFNHSNADLNDIRTGQLKRALKKVHNFNAKFYCLFSEGHIAIKHSKAKLQTQFIASPYKLISSHEIIVPLSSLITSGAYNQRPLLIQNFIGGQAPQIFLNSFSEILLRSNLKLLQDFNLVVEVPDEHLLIVIDKNEVSKIIYRMPYIYQSNNVRSIKSYLQKTINKILNCYQNHTNDFSINKLKEFIDAEFLKYKNQS